MLVNGELVEITRQLIVQALLDLGQAWVPSVEASAAIGVDRCIE